MLPFYKDRDTALHRLHPAAKVVASLAVVIAALVLSHPVYLVALLAGTIVLAARGRVVGPWWSFMRLFTVIALTVVAVNLLLSSRGETAFWEGPYVTGFGQLSVSLEGVVFGAVMALRLFTVVSAFTILTLTVHPDEFTQLLARFAYRSGLAISLSTRFYPAVVRDAAAIMDAQRSRGLDLDSGGRMASIRRRIAVVMPLFHTSLERAVGTAEAMEARGFGSPLRTRWTRRSWGPHDLLTLASAVVLVIVSTYLALWRDGMAEYYPTIQLELGAASLLTGLLLLALTVVTGAGGDAGHGAGGGPGD